MPIRKNSKYKVDLVKFIGKLLAEDSLRITYILNEAYNTCIFSFSTPVTVCIYVLL